ncbi:MAG: riboflavin synthase [Acidobacteria bacterium]|nr:riboflavin synthase [Acidobacteriota bacterium]MCB9398107.1 riboflavin synthase [Acidobacteriota bacterium]
MFTGIIEEVGHVLSRKGDEAGQTLNIQARTVLEGSQIGDSIAVNGVCLTVTHLAPDQFSVDVAPETLIKTNLGNLNPHDPVNLERALTPTSRMGGHLVQGHVDGTVELVEKKAQGQAVLLHYLAAPQLMKYIVNKGFVCLDGASLTVIDALEDRFSLMLIPITQEKTILAEKALGYRANLEVDILGKYLEKWIGPKNNWPQRF